jgi:histone acetyltransferase (RNA polymerase elongator complex component)
VCVGDIEKIVEEHLESILLNVPREDAYIEIAFFGGSFTGIEIEQQKELLSVANKYLTDGKIDGIRCSTRPDYINDDILKMVKSYGMSVIELGVQSTDEEVLMASNRGHSYNDVVKACKLIKKYDISLGLQMMTGLPADTYEKSVKTAEGLISLNPSCVRIYPTLVMENTGLYDMYKNGLYTPFSLDETICLCSQLVKMFYFSNIDVIRIGLQTTDNINKDTVIGPYHPAIAELIQGRLVRDVVEKNADLTSDSVNITVNKSMVSSASGHNRENKKYFKEKYGVDIKINTSEILSRDEVIVDNKKYNIYC